MTTNAYDFCSFSDSDKLSLNNVLNTTFKVADNDKVYDFYEYFASLFYSDKALDIKNYMREIERVKLLPQTANIDFCNKYKSPEYQIGVDLPIFIKPYKDIKRDKTVFFIAEDALRSEINNNIIISTPFAVHIKQLREGRLRVYWSVFKELLDNGYSVYITDVYKIWIKHINKPRRNKEALIAITDLYKNFIASLKKEIEWIEPSLIVCYGNVARNAIVELGVDKDVAKYSYMHFPHLAARSVTWQKTFTMNTFKGSDNNKIRATYENKIMYINDKIKSILNENTQPII